MSKYEPLWRYVKENNKEEYKLSFEEVKELPDYGYEFKKLSLKEKWVWIIKKK